MTWFVVGGIAIGATAGAIVGSKKGGDDVWKDALIGGAIGGTAGAGAGVAGGAGVLGGFGAEAGAAAVPAAVEGGGGILAAEGLAGGSGLALGGAGLEAGGAMAGGAGIAGGAAPAAATVAPEAGAGILGGGSFGGAGGAGVGATGGFAPEAGFVAPQAANFAPGMQAPIQMVSNPTVGSFGSGASTVGEMGGLGSEYTSVVPAGEEFAGSGTYTTTAGSAPSGSFGGGSPQKSLLSGLGDWASNINPFQAGILGFTALGMSGALNNNNNQTFGGSTVTPAGYPLSPNFKPSRYQPTRTYAAGGGITDLDIGSRDTAINSMIDPVAMMASGGSVDWEKKAKEFAAMTQAAEAPAEREPSFMDRSKVDPKSAGIYVDDDVDTRNQSALTAAQTRMNKLAKKYGVSYQQKTAQEDVRNTEMASGGIASLGGYAAGGNPRLLRGPGDGMSDDIPATIADKQPARLADGEFVVPADVVSGLGNGSTEAGAKKLHQMMDKVRVDRTGTKKQGKQIKAEKYVPGMADGGIAKFDDGGYVDSSQQPTWFSDWLASTNTSAPTAAPANTTPSGYNPDYYNPQYYQNQLSSAQQRLAAAQQAATPSAGGELSQTAQENPQLNALYQQYLGRNIGQGEAFATDPNYIRSSPEAQAWAQRQSDVTAAQEAVTSNQQNLDRLSNTSIAYNPYTIANRPSAAEPQFYGNIYQGNTPDYSTPGYTLTGGNLGQWSNVAGEAARAAQPASLNQQVTQAYLQNLGRAPDTEGFNAWMSSGLTGPQISQRISQSDESRAMAPGAITDYFNRYLSRNPSQAGLDYWTNQALTSGMQGVQQGISRSPEAQVRNAFEQYLGRTPRQAGLDYWTQQAERSGIEGAVQGIANSPEAQVRSAFQQYLNRDPRQSGLDYWVNQMNQGMTADQMRNLVATSQEGVSKNPTMPVLAQAAPAASEDSTPAAAESRRRGGILAAKK